MYLSYYFAWLSWYPTNFQFSEVPALPAPSCQTFLPLQLLNSSMWVQMILVTPQFVPPPSGNSKEQISKRWSFSWKRFKLVPWYDCLCYLIQSWSCHLIYTSDYWKNYRAVPSWRKSRGDSGTNSRGLLQTPKYYITDLPLPSFEIFYIVKVGAIPKTSERNLLCLVNLIFEYHPGDI